MDNKDDDFDELLRNGVTLDPEIKQEFEDAEALLTAIEEVKREYNMQAEFLVEFIRNIRSGHSVQESIWYAYCEWDL